MLSSKYFIRYKRPMVAVAMPITRYQVYYKSSSKSKCLGKRCFWSFLKVSIGIDRPVSAYAGLGYSYLLGSIANSDRWMVHNKLNPAFSRDDPIYRQAFMKLDSEFSGLAKSKFVSTQWTAEFTRVIFSRPIFIQRHPLDPGEGINVEGIPKCDACNHRVFFCTLFPGPSNTNGD